MYRRCQFDVLAAAHRSELVDVGVSQFLAARRLDCRPERQAECLGGPAVKAILCSGKHEVSGPTHPVLLNEQAAAFICGRASLQLNGLTTFVRTQQRSSRGGSTRQGNIEPAALVGNGLTVVVASAIDVLRIVLPGEAATLHSAG